MKILFFIGTLNTGGAERQMTQLAKGFSNRGHNATVVTVFPGGQFVEFIQKIPEIKLFSLWTKRSNFFLVRVYQILYSPIKLIKYTKDSDLCYSMLETANFIAWVTMRFSRNDNLVWGIRASTFRINWKMNIFNKLCALVSKNIKLVIVNSYAGQESLFKYGFRPQKVQIIPNGIDTEKFQFDERERKKICQELEILSNQQVIGIIGRIIPIKDHSTLIKAASLLSMKVKNLRILIVGVGSADYIDDLYTLVDELGLANRVIWLGSRRDIVAIYSALDVLVSSSLGEGFSNVIGEAMSCGIPCVVTDVGDSASIVGDPTRVVRPKDPKLLAEAMYKVLRLENEIEGTMALRDRIINNYSIDNLIDSTEQTLKEMI